VVATSYLLGVSTRRVEQLAASLGIIGLSKSQVSVMAAELDELVGSFRNRPLDVGPYAFMWIDALTHKVREGGRTVNVHCLIAAGVNAGGHREILGIDVTSSEDGAGWLAFLRGLAARPVRRPAGHQRRPRRASERDRIGAAWRRQAAVPHPLRRPPGYAELSAGAAGGGLTGGGKVGITTGLRGRTAAGRAAGSAPA
jgi:hypothetical protein